MSARIVKERTRESYTTYNLFYGLAENDNCGCAFACDKDGNVDEAELAPEAVENYKICRDNVDKKYGQPRVQKYTFNYTTNTEAICECGKQIELYDEYMGACECPHCGRWHNLFGQTLESPDKWGFDPYD